MKIRRRTVIAAASVAAIATAVVTALRRSTAYGSP